MFVSMLVVLIVVLVFVVVLLVVLFVVVLVVLLVLLIVLGVLLIFTSHWYLTILMLPGMAITAISTSLIENKNPLNDKQLFSQNIYLSKKMEEFKNKENTDQKKHIQFSEKIDELNQETNTLLEEIDKWQT